MSELAVIVREADALRRRAEPFMIATVVGTSGSSYRRPGARMILTEERWVAGSVSGGCLEGDVLRRGAHRTRHGAPTVVTYDSTSEDDAGWGFGLGCNGVVDVMIERIDATTTLDPLLFASECIEAEARGVLVTVFRSEHDTIAVGARLALGGPDQEGGEAIRTTLPDGATRDMCLRLAREGMTAEGTEATVHRFDGITLLVETLEPPPTLFVCGASHDAVPVVALARSLGWRTVVAVAHPSAATRERFLGADELLTGDPAALVEAVACRRRACAVVMTHTFDRDRDYLAALLRSSVAYIGVLGPRRRAERMLDELKGGELPPTERMLQRVHAPVGLDLGAETPQEIALSIVSEVQTELARASAVRLRDRTGPIHAPAPVIDEAPLRERAAPPRVGRVVGVVLAAGSSSRLGRPKQLEPFRGKPLLRHVVEAVRAAQIAELGVVIGASAARVRPVLDGTRVSVIVNDDWPEGIASSVRAAVAWAERQDAQALVLMLADQPLLDHEHVDRLVAEWRAGAPAAGSRYAGAVGVPAIFDRRLFADLARLRGDRGAARLLRERSGVTNVPWSAGAVDVDTEVQARALPVFVDVASFPPA